MPDLNTANLDSVRDYAGQLIGQLEPITLPQLDGDTYVAAQMAVSDATRLLLGVDGDLIDFHIVYRDGPNAPVMRSRWRVQAVVGGPALRPFTAGAYTTTVNYRLRIWPYGERLQVIFGEDETNWTYRGEMSAIIPALLLRQLWATVPGAVGADGARVLTVGSMGTVRFTPQQMQFDRMFNDQIKEVVPWDFADVAATNLISSYQMMMSPNQERIPGIWFVIDDAIPYSRKVSYLVPTSNLSWIDRWDDPDEPAPAFTPLTWPANPGENPGDWLELETDVPPQ